MHYRKYWGLKIAPFENVPDPRFYFPAPKHEEGLYRLIYGVEARKGAVMLTGEVGCGKTMLSRQLVQRLSEKKYDIALLANPSVDSSEFLGEVVYQFGLPSEGTKLERMHRLNDHLLANMKEQKETLIIVDEAQAIHDDVLFEELRMLLNFQLNDRNLLTLILLGQPELNVRIRVFPQLVQRIGIRFHLSAFNLQETTSYVEFRLKTAGAEKQPIFTPAAMELIFNHSGGIPRNINTLADLCLLSGFLEQSSPIEGSLVTRVIEDLRLGETCVKTH